MTTLGQFALQTIIYRYPKAEYVNHVNGTFSVVADPGYSAKLLGGGETKLEALIDAASRIEIQVPK